MFMITIILKRREPQRPAARWPDIGSHGAVAALAVAFGAALGVLAGR
ncbi:hypothetical protein AB0M23_16215 [Streptomyces sp. NPDC052077]